MLLETQKLCKELLATSKNATNFSIAELLKKETSERRSISPKSTESCPDINEDEVDVDVEEYSDSESIPAAATPAKTVSPSPSDLSDRLTPETKTKAQPPPRIMGSCNSDELMQVQCHLETKELWDKFNEFETEMIITKTGRRMFPTMRVSFSGPLRQGHPTDKYVVLMDIVPVDNKRYRYAYHRSAWLVAGKADPPPPQRLYANPETPIGPEALRRQIISFEKVKVTNNETDKSGQIVLNSMHRYQPRIHLVLLEPGQNIPATPKDLQDVPHKTFVFHETVFTAVTAYQNQLITKLKIDSNPFAKGFRDSSRLTEFDRDPAESMLMEHHLRSQFRLFPEQIMAQMTGQASDEASKAILEQTRQQLQMWGRSPYQELLLQQMYQRGALNLGMAANWQNLWPQQLQAAFLQQQTASVPRVSPPSTVISPNPSPPSSTDVRSSVSGHYSRFMPYQRPATQTHLPPPPRSPQN